MNKQSLAKVFGTDFRDSQDNYKASCPFHSDRTPSFYVHKEEYIAHCFGCGISGNIDELAAQFLSASLTEARAALQLSIEDRIRTRLERGREVTEEVQRTRTIPESWLAPFKKGAHRYVIDRGFHPKTIQDSGARYDPVLQRQVFPHRDRQGRLRGAVGRACKEQQPKWLFYFGYDKGCTLYAPFELTPIRPIILVEGVFDVLWLRQHGYENGTAPIGATATQHQLSEVSELGEDVILGFDNDESGQEGNRRVYEALRYNCRCWFLDWPEHANDWMDLGAEEIKTLIKTRVTPVQYSLKGKRTKTGKVPNNYSARYI